MGTKPPRGCATVCLQLAKPDAASPGAPVGQLTNPAARRSFPPAPSWGPTKGGVGPHAGPGTYRCWRPRSLWRRLAATPHRGNLVASARPGALQNAAHPRSSGVEPTDYASVISPLRLEISCAPVAESPAEARCIAATDAPQNFCHSHVGQRVRRLSRRGAGSRKSASRYCRAGSRVHGTKAEKSCRAGTRTVAVGPAPRHPRRRVVNSRLPTQRIVLTNQLVH